MYDEWLKDHTISALSVESETLARVLLTPTVRRCLGAIEIALLRFGALCVHGDIDTTVFGYYRPANPRGWRDHLRWLARVDYYDYAEEKARAGMAGKLDVFESEIACGDILEWRRHRFFGKDIARQLYQRAKDGDEYELKELAWRAAIVESEDIERLGRCTSAHVYAALAAIRRANVLITARDNAHVS